MKNYLSIDGGGTKTAFLLCDENGKELARSVLGPANYVVNSLENVVETFSKGIQEVCTQAHIQEREINAGFVAIAGFKDIPEDVPVVTKVIDEAFPHLKLQLGNDVENALASSLLGEVGIHVIAGTGSIGLGYDNEEKFIRSGGWHHLFGGDEGSGYWIGAHLIQAFTKQADHREERTLLYDYLMEKYELLCPENILKLVIQLWNGERDKIASMSKDAAYLASQNDPCACAIFKRAGEELASIVKSIYKQCSFPDKIKISYSGGVFKSKQYLMPSFEKELKDIQYDLVEPQLEPVSGGIILAMKLDQCFICEEIIENLKKIKF